MQSYQINQVSKVEHIYIGALHWCRTPESLQITQGRLTDTGFDLRFFLSNRLASPTIMSNFSL